MSLDTIHALAISGSVRVDSYNRKALAIAISIASELGLKVTQLDLNTLDLPFFNEDLRKDGFPDSVKHLKAAITSADVLLVATPEYNHSIPGILKNVIDWASDKTNPFSGKTAAIFGASNGLNGTLRAQLHLRQILTALDVEMVAQPQVFIRLAQEAFLQDGSFADPRIYKQLHLLIEKTEALVRRKKHK
jgi:chromate reductase